MIITKAKRNNNIIIYSIVAIIIGSLIPVVVKYNFKIMLLIYTMLIAGLVFFIMKFKLRYSMTKILEMTFFVYIPFFDYISINNVTDFHIAAKPYYRFNVIHLFCIYFLIKILFNIKQIKKGADFKLLSLLILMIVISFTQAINIPAAFYDFTRYFCVFIIYIYFSRLFNYEKNEDSLNFMLVLTCVMQLGIGLMQKAIGGPLGLHFLGERHTVFRAEVTGYEMGMSGTFPHPGPLALYALFILAWVLFNEKNKPIVRYVGILSATVIIVLAAGRTSIGLMGLVYAYYFFKKLKNFKSQYIGVGIFMCISLVIVYMMMRDDINLIIDRFVNSDMMMQFNSRLIHVELASHYLEDNFLFGIGLNNYLDNTLIDFPNNFATNFFLSNPIHNAYLLLSVEIGIIGATAYTLFLLNNFIYKIKVSKVFDECKKLKVNGYIIALGIYMIYNMQGWGGLQDNGLLLIILNSAFVYNICMRSNEIARG